MTDKPPFKKYHIHVIKEDGSELIAPCIGRTPEAMVEAHEKLGWKVRWLMQVPFTHDEKLHWEAFDRSLKQAEQEKEAA